MKKQLAAIIVIASLLIPIPVMLYEGYEMRCEFPFLWRESDQHVLAQDTCNKLAAWGRALTQALESSMNVTAVASVVELGETLGKKGIMNMELFTQDGWGNDLKLKIKNEVDNRSILVYSDTPNELPMGPHGYNLYCCVTLNPTNGKVSVTATNVSEKGRIVVTKY